MSSSAAEPVRLSVTNVVTALTCPRLFWFAKVEGKSSLLDRDQGQGLGRRLHRLIEDFETSRPSTPELQAAFQGRPLASRGLRIRARLEELLHRNVLLPEVTRERAAGREDGEATLRIWHGLRVYASLLAPLLARNSRALPPEQVLPRTLLASELEARLTVDLGDRTCPVEIRGRADGLWFDHSKERALLIEYKTRPLRGSGEDFLQLSLYHWLLEEGSGVPAHGRLVPLLDEDPDVPEGRDQRGPGELRAIRGDDRIRGHLQDMVQWLRWSPGRGAPPPGPESEATCGGCPVQAECFRRLPRERAPEPATSRPPAPPPAPGPPPPAAAPAARMVVHLGAERPQGAPIEWYPNDTSVFVNPNLAILGTMGTGKTQCTRSLLYQLSRCPGNVGGRPPRFLIFDYKGDYTKPEFAEVVGAQVLPAYRLPINPLSLPVGPTTEDPRFKLVWNTCSTFVDSLGRAMALGEVQRLRLREHLEAAFAARGITDEDPPSWRRPAPTVPEIAAAFLDEAGDKRDKLYGVLLELSRSELFSADPAQAHRLWDALEGVTVIDLQGGISESLQDLAVATILDQLYADMQLHGESRTGGPGNQLRELRMMLLVDEADNFMGKEFPVLRKILKEGRSYGVGALLSTQYLRHFVTKHERYHEYFSTWVVHEFDGLTRAHLKEAFGIHESGAIQDFQRSLKRCAKLESLAVLRREGDRGQQVLEMRDLPFFELV